MVYTPPAVHLRACSHRVDEDLHVEEISELRVCEYQNTLNDDDSFALGPANMACTSTHKNMGTSRISKNILYEVSYEGD